MQNTTEQQVLDTFTSVGAFVKANTVTFCSSFETLVAQLEDSEIKTLYGDFLRRYTSALDAVGIGHATSELILNAQPLLVAPLLLTWLHLTKGTPLYLDDQLLSYWIHPAGIMRCAACLYVFPAPFPRCTLCGGNLTTAIQWEQPCASRMVN